MNKPIRDLRKNRSFEELEKQLRQPFAHNDLEWLSNFHQFARNDKTKDNLAIAVVPYIRRESIIVRLNEVLGADGWRTKAQDIGTLGVFQYIEIFNGYEWIGKVDGSTMKSNEQLDGDESRNKNRDVVKGVMSKSIRRAAEAWGIGLYLHFVPQLYAIKRADDCYDAYDKWGMRGVNFDVRWDPPSLPLEFLPKYMTPEQKVQIDRMVNYFSDKKAENLSELIDKYENDPDSVPYEDAKEIIESIQLKLKERIQSVNKFQFYPKITPTETKKEKKPKKDKPTKKEEKEAHPFLTSAKNEIEDHRVNELEKLAKELSNKDPDGLWHDTKYLKDLFEAIKQHKSGPPYFSVKIFNEAVKKVSEASDTFDEDDDLPF